MRRAEKLEKKILMGYAKLIDQEKKLLNRWKLIGTVLSFFGWFFFASTFLYILEHDFIPSSLLIISFASGLCIALGAWFSCIPIQWPILRKFIDTERLQQRISDID